MKRAVAALDELVYRLIRDRRAEATDRGDVLSMLLAARDEDDGTGLDDRQVRDEVMTLILAGHETTANTLAWTFHLLLDHPDAAGRLRDELDRVLAGRSPTMQDLPNLPYALAVLKESMRLYPPAYVVGRQAIRDVQLGPHTVRAGTLLLVNIFGMHHRADLFPDPERFAPERFLGDGEKQLPRGAYLPFGAGARICIGNHFALMEAHLLLAALAQRVRFERRGPAQIAPEPLVTLRPRGGLPVRAVRRRDVVSSAA
jgi:cytochrome P450